MFEAAGTRTQTLKYNYIGIQNQTEGRTRDLRKKHVHASHKFHRLLQRSLNLFLKNGYTII